VINQTTPNSIPQYILLIKTVPPTGTLPPWWMLFTFTLCLALELSSEIGVLNMKKDTHFLSTKIYF